MAKGRSTEAEYDRRVDILVPLIVMGLTRREIIQFVTKKADPPWNINTRSIDRITASARDRIARAAETIIEEELGLGILRLEDLFKRSLSIQDYKAALSVQKERHELLGLKKQTVEIDLRVTTWDDLEKEVNADKGKNKEDE